MDRRQRKTREAIFTAFISLLAKKKYTAITVEQILQEADVARATFYSHFETRDLLLRALCEELFCHIFDAAAEAGSDHRHIFDCEEGGDIFLHLWHHIRNNDNRILSLLQSENNELFVDYFKESLKELIKKQPRLLAAAPPEVPMDFWVNHVASSFCETVSFRDKETKDENPDAPLHYFLSVCGL